MKVEKKFYFLAGLPRSGSTLLASIFSQNPEIYATPTSPMLDLLCGNEYVWSNNPSVIANKVETQIYNISYGVINGTWQHVPQKIIIDKHRAWARNANVMKYFFGQDAKVIVTARDIPSILASFIQLIRKQPNNSIDKELLKLGHKITDQNRADFLLECYIQDPWKSFRQGYEENKSSMKIVEYDDLTENPHGVMEDLYNFMELPKFQHDFNNVENKTKDDDLLAWGLDGLHSIRSEVKKTAKSAREILGSNLFNKYKSLNLEFWRN